MGASIFALLTNLASPLVGLFKHKQEIKRAKQALDAKLKSAKQTGDYNLDLTDKEWEAVGKRSEGDGWKDEWVTIIITIAIPFVFISAILSAYTGDPIYFEAIKEGVAAIKDLLPNFPQILEVVVYAAVSIKAFNGLVR